MLQKTENLHFGEIFTKNIGKNCILPRLRGTTDVSKKNSPKSP